jgi:hypothetical protein
MTHQTITALIGGYNAPTAFYLLVEKQIKKGMHKVMPGNLYTTRMICGEEFWLTLGNNYKKRLAGRCLAHMVVKGRFPFNFIQYKRSPTKRYQLQ